MSLFLPFQNGEKVIFTAETVAQQNGTVESKQALKVGPLVQQELRGIRVEPIFAKTLQESEMTPIFSFH